jgi:CubicO group peptidase (beta-lactamase class C family)
VTELERLAAKHAPRPPVGLVLARDGEIVAVGAVDSDSVFELGSITKAATGMLLAEMVARGEVALDDTLDTYLAGAQPITLKALATHTAGLPRLPRALLRRIGARNRDPYARTSVEELVRDLAGTRLKSPRFRYSNFGFALLGQALAARARMPFEELLSQRVHVEGLWAHGGPAPAQPHSRRGRPVPAWTLGAYAPAGCLHGTAQGVLNLIDAARHSDALTVHYRRGPIEMGLGWLRMQGVWWHNGGTGGTRTHCAFRAEGGAVAVLTNRAKAPERILRGVL